MNGIAGMNFPSEGPKSKHLALGNLHGVSYLVSQHTIHVASKPLFMTKRRLLNVFFLFFKQKSRAGVSFLSWKNCKPSGSFKLARDQRTRHPLLVMEESTYFLLRRYCWITAASLQISWRDGDLLCPSPRDHVHRQLREVNAHDAETRKIWQEAHERLIESELRWMRMIHPFDNCDWDGHAQLIVTGRSRAKPDVILLTVGGGGLLAASRKV